MSDASNPDAGFDRARVGFGVAWAALIVSVGISWLIGAVGVLPSFGGSGRNGLLAGVFPPLMMLALLVFGFASGHRRFASGVLAAFGSMFALTLLLVGACFGLFAMDGF